MPVGTQAMSSMNNSYPGTGTTLCPHCGTRFKIAREQLEAHHGMVRCGHCQQAFDTRPNFAPEEIDPQLELPILDETDAPENQLQAELPADEQPSSVPPGPVQAAVVQPLTLADQAAFFTQDVDGPFLSRRRRSWYWAISTLLLLLLLLAQAAYLFRVELAARVPGLKPALLAYCRILECSMPLPQQASLMSIESSELQDDPAHKSQIMLIALLRNHAAYAQAFPDLELTLTDAQDNALARRTFTPPDYLSTPEELDVGLSANQELALKLHLDTADLKPVGYRLMLYYSDGQVR